MELYQLKTFLAVAEEEHLTRASRRLNISQPSVSTHIKSLEQELGVALFARTPKGVILSHAGCLVKAKAESALKAVAAVKQTADQLKKNVTGVARIGLNIDARFLKASELQTLLTRRYANLELHYCQRHSLEALGQVRSGLLEAAVVFSTPTKPSLDSQKLASMGISIVAPNQWKDRLGHVELEALADFPWIWTDECCPFNRIITQLFEPLGKKPQKAAVVDQGATIRELISSGVGMGLMVEPEALEAARQKQVMILHKRITTLELAVLYLEKRLCEPIVHTIVEALCDVWAQPFGDDSTAKEERLELQS